MATSRKTPAKKAVKRGSKSNVNRWATIQLPDGFTPIMAGEFGEPWDFEEKPTVTGTVVGEIREMDVGKGRDRRTARVTTVFDEDDGRSYNIWDSAALRPFFDRLEEGMRVSVVFQGYRDTGKASPMKVFVGAIANEDAGEQPKASGRKAPARKNAPKKTAKKTAKR